MRKEKGLITSTTVALFPSYHHAYQTIIVDLSGKKVWSKKPAKEIINEACLDDGASYEGKIKAVRHALPYHRKTPLIINKDQHIYAFPTMSPDKYDCIWLFHLHILEISQTQNKTYITFINGYKLEVNCSVKVLNRQRERAAVTMNHFAFKNKKLHVSSPAEAEYGEEDEIFEFKVYTGIELTNQDQSFLQV
ncbi:competence protein ComK [Rossellomorea oryzaecorticis]|uniref:Competence protein ComK n=1 Tax=Rossellomorea oryzaecorticis TaxID=1396505 RepID=A0ABU9K4A1_9BACI